MSYDTTQVRNVLSNVCFPCFLSGEVTMCVKVCYDPARTSYDS